MCVGGGRGFKGGLELLFIPEGEGGVAGLMKGWSLSRLFSSYPFKAVRSQPTVLPRPPPPVCRCTARTSPRPPAVGPDPPPAHARRHPPGPVTGGAGGGMISTVRGPGVVYGKRQPSLLTLSDLSLSWRVAASCWAAATSS